MKKWFILPSLLLLFVTIVFIGFIPIRASIRSSHLILRELHEQMQRQVNTELSQRLGSAMQLNQMHYNHLECGMLDLSSPAKRERYFSGHVKLYPDVAMTFIGLPDGSFYGARRTKNDEIQVARNDSSTGGASWYYRIDSTGQGVEVKERFPDFDARTRPWYTEAAEAGEPVFSSVYSHFVFHEPTITASYPIYNQDHQLEGVLGVNYLLSWLGETLGDLPIGDSGEVFVVDGAGMLVASTLDSPAYRIRDGASELIPIQDVNSTLIQSATSLPAYEQVGALPKFSIWGKEYYVGFSEYQEHGLDWDIYVVMAEDDFFGDVNNAIRHSVMIMILSLILSVIFTTYIANRVVKPITTLSASAEALAHGELASIPDNARRDEIGRLTRSFNEMGLRITQTVTTLEETVALRTQELEERNEELKRLSFTDGLIGISNRRQFDTTLQHAWNTALRYRWCIGLFMIDIDLFKDFNDSYGHPAGDDALRAIGTLIAGKARRSTDLAARFGGEEFIVLIQDAQPKNLVAFAEDIRRGVESLQIEHANSPFGRVTISIGVAHMTPSSGESSEQLICKADQALYQAKNNGRNMVVENTESE